MDETMFSIWRIRGSQSEYDDLVIETAAERGPSLIAFLFRREETRREKAGRSLHKTKGL